MAPRWCVPACAAALLALSGCGKEKHEFPVACQVQAEDLQQALEGAPGGVMLGDDRSIADCVRKARSDADLQNFGAALAKAGDRLSREALTDERRALQLGYLIGATVKGAGKSEGIGLELARKVENTAFSLDEAPPRIRAALQRGRRAGTERG